jgi:VWFA-related protein
MTHVSVADAPNPTCHSEPGAKPGEEPAVSAHPKCRSLLASAVVFLLAIALPAQQAPDVLSTPTLKSRSDLVLVPVVVRDKKGNHIPGLTKDAFQLEENGRDQLISLFEEVHADSSVRPIAPTLDQGYSNLPFDNARELRLTILLLDLLNTTPLQRTDGKDQLVKFLSKGLAPNQPVSLLCLTPDGLRLVSPFSSDSASLIQRLKKTPPGGERLIPRRETTRLTLTQLRQIAQSYTGIPGRKTLIFAAGNIPDPQYEPNAYADRVSASDWFQQTFKDLIDANIAVYPIQLLAWTANPASRNVRPPSAQATLQEFAANTGGNRCLETNDVTKCLTEAVEDSRSYYMLGFSVAPDDRKPGWRDLKVKVSAEHANVRARSGFYYGNSAPSDAQSVHDAEINALASPLPYSAVPMNVRVLPPSPTPATPASAGPKITVEFMVTIPLTSIRIDPSNSSAMDLEIGAIALTRDPNNPGNIKDAGEFLHPVHGNPTPQLLQQFAREGIKLQEKLDLPPGSYDLRFMVRDNTTTQIGTVVFPLEVK